MNHQEWAKAFFSVVDPRQPDKIAKYMTEDVRLQLANLEPSIGVDTLEAAFQAAADRFKSIDHAIQGIWTGRCESGGVVGVEAIARYELPGGRIVEPPCASTSPEERKIGDYRIFIEPSPAFVD